MDNQPDPGSLNSNPWNNPATPPAPNSSNWGKPKRFALKLSMGWLKQSRVYLAEYAVLLIVTGALLGIIKSLFAGIIDHIGGHPPTPSWGSGFMYTASIGVLSSLVVLVPFFLALNRRTKGSEVENPDIKNIGWRKGFLGVFLVIVALNAIGYSIAFVYEVLSRLAVAGLATGEKPVVWRTLVSHGFAIILFGFTAWLFSNDYRNQRDQGKGWLKRLHTFGLAGLAVVLGVVFVLVPLRYQRNVFVDNAIVNDLREIKQLVRSYEDKEGDLPKSLNQLDLDDRTKARAKAYKYEYQTTDGGYKLCAEFKTSTKDKKRKTGNILDLYLSGGASLYDSPEQDDEDPSIHDKGRQCFDTRSFDRPYYNDLNSTDGTARELNFVN